MFSLHRTLALLMGASGLFLQSCAHYQAGNGSTIAFSSIQISPVVNRSLTPQANEVLNHDLREVFIRSGKVAVESAGADAILKVTLTRYSRETIATNSQDTGLARKYALTMTASCELINPGENIPYFKDRQVEATIDIFLDAGQTRAETNALSLLSKKLAEAIANEVLQVW